MRHVQQPDRLRDVLSQAKVAPGESARGAGRRDPGPARPVTDSPPPNAEAFDGAPEAGVVKPGAVARLHHDLSLFELRLQGEGAARRHGFSAPEFDPNIGSVSIDAGVVTTSPKMVDEEREMRRRLRERGVQEILQRVREAYAEDPDQTAGVLVQHGISPSEMSAFLFPTAAEEVHDIVIGGISVSAASGGPGGGSGGWG